MPSAHPQILHRVQEQADAGHLGQLWPQPCDHSLTGFATLRHRLQIGEHEAAAGARATGKADHGIDRRIALDDVDQLAQLALHRLDSGHQVDVTAKQKQIDRRTDGEIAAAVGAHGGPCADSGVLIE